MLGEVFFTEPLRQTLRQITVNHNDYPLFGYKFDYETETRGEGFFNITNFPAQIGKAHGLDALFVLNQVCRNTAHVSNPTESDIRVNLAMSEIVEKFMVQSMNKNGEDLPVYSSQSLKVLRISSDGIDTIDCNFKSSASNLTKLKLLYSTLMVTIFPNRV